MGKYVIVREETDGTIYGIFVFPLATKKEIEEVDYISIINDAKMQAIREHGDNWIINDILKVLHQKYPYWGIKYEEASVSSMMI